MTQSSIQNYRKAWQWIRNKYLLKDIEKSLPKEGPGVTGPKSGVRNGQNNFKKKMLNTWENPSSFLKMKFSCLALFVQP